MVVGELAMERDVIIIGGGPGGYSAAIRAAQLGKEVTLVEKNHMGGVCLNEGCIPSKVFAEAAKQSQAFPHFEKLGFEMEKPNFDITKLQTYKNQVITQLRAGVEALCKANKIERIEGSATFLSDDRIGVENGHQFDVYRFNHAIIATGNRAIPHFNGTKNIVNERTVYSIEKIPSSLIVSGGDYLALEVAFSYAALGSTVTCICEEREFSYLDEAISKELKRQFKKKKIKFISGEITKVVQAENIIEIQVKNSKGEIHQLLGEYFYSSASYEANISDLGIDRLGMKLDESGFILVDSQCRTSVRNLYAIGDVTGGKQLAVKAIRQGKVAAEVLSGIPSEWDDSYLPTVVHTIPSIAAVGMTEEEAQEISLEYEVGQFSIAGNGYAGLREQKDGFVKVLKENGTDRVIGVHILGDGAVELISSGVLALEMVARDEDLLFPSYPHPSMNEALLEAVEAIKGQAIHQAPAKKEVSAK
ncbi:dihydrolipoamide dehydrogenase [Bacillus oleivorans]|uniref:Dihydrolipoyl dehydrogenase n=1 Tax=Bacillus oleivorans TaxID=1448271 RepID=A0A285CQV3_9BACI|nr:dihydrolipoyl dehydrogenase [Bacillus oleivorans]SNX69927.1 dihydrolipoamide dehydrogenase [Bacillus oleivorans]